MSRGTHVQGDCLLSIITGCSTGLLGTVLGIGLDSNLYNLLKGFLNFPFKLRASGSSELVGANQCTVGKQKVLSVKISIFTKNVGS